MNNPFSDGIKERKKCKHKIYIFAKVDYCAFLKRNNIQPNMNSATCNTRDCYSSLYEALYVFNTNKKRSSIAEIFVNLSIDRRVILMLVYLLRESFLIDQEFRFTTTHFLLN